MAPPRRHQAEASATVFDAFPEEELHPGPSLRTDARRQTHAQIAFRMFAAGGVAGAVSKSLTAPFARLTILYQTQGFTSLGHTPRLDAALLHVVRHEGLRALWKGNLATIVHRIPYSAASFLTYEQTLSFLNVILPKQENVISGRVDLLRRFLAGALAGSLSTVVAYPIDLVRTRLAAQTCPDYKGILDVLRRTYVEERATGLYKGLGGSLVQVVPNVALNLCAYETLRSYWMAHHRDTTSPGLVGSVVCGGASGLFSASITYPIDLIRRRMQLQGLHGAPRTYTSYADAIRKAWQSGGIRAFYTGIAAEYFKVVPGVAIIYSVYEFSKKSLGVEGYNAGRRYQATPERTHASNSLPSISFFSFFILLGFMETMTTTTTTTATTTATEELSHHHSTAARPDGEGSTSASRSTGRSLEFTMRQYPSAKMKLDQFFLEWLSLPEYERLIATVLDNAANNRSLKAGVEEAIRGDTLPNSASSTAQLTPPMSPKSQSSCKPADENGITLMPSKSNSETALTESCSSPAPSKQIPIPQFYFPEGSPAEKELHSMKHERIRELFLPFHPMGMQQKDFVQVVREVCDLPGMLAYPLFRRLTDGTTLMTQEIFESWWESERLATASTAARMIAILRRDPSVQWLTNEDLVPLLRAVVDYHPSLEFLSDHPEFQERYIETVSYRIFYVINKSRNGKISLRELKRSDLIDALYELDAEQDINKVLRYFSYEHFYVIYCKFWELDNDHDFLLERHDLIRYGCHCLTYQIVDKIFEVMVGAKDGAENGKMDYQEFVWFILSEEDKTTDASIEYWFRCVDLDGDGFLSAHDMRPFYDGQLERMESTSCEPVMFEDVICQLHDLIQPDWEGYFSVKDLQKYRSSASILFNTLFNLHKFIAYEHRDPFTVRAEQECSLADWDRFAAQEYDILAAEEEQDESMRDGANALTSTSPHAASLS